jgi:hypothetical protein
VQRIIPAAEFFFRTAQGKMRAQRFFDRHPGTPFPADIRIRRSKTVAADAPSMSKHVESFIS